MPLQILGGLVLCNLIWSAHPAMSKLVMADVSPALTGWLRYFSALVSYLLIIPFLKRRKDVGPAFLRYGTVGDIALAGMIGFMAFCFAPLLQMTGLHASRATDNALIVAMEPLMTVALARVFIGERLSRAHLLAYGLALSGFFLLAGFNPLTLISGVGASSTPVSRAHLLGDLLMLLALIGEASYSVLSIKLLQRHLPLGIFGTALFIGVAILTVVILAVFGPATFLQLSNLSWKSWIGILWLGPLGTAFAYFYWMKVLKDASVASLALTLFIQPVFGSMWGYLFLDERLSEIQALGALLIIMAVLTQGVIALYRARIVRSAELPFDS